jgi:hypothetical protein
VATSGTYGTYVYRVGQLIEDAALRAGIPAQMLTSDLLVRSMRALNLLLSEMPNIRIYTWQQQQIILPLYEGQAAVTAPTGTFNLLDRTLRKPTRLTGGTVTSSAGGTVANAVDDNFETLLTQTSTNGNVRIVFTTATQLYEVGILWGAVNATVQFVVERSVDSGVTWLQVGSTYTVTATDRTWSWVQVEGAPATYWRVRITNGTTLIAREVYFGGAPTDIPLSTMTRTEYMQMPNRLQPGQPLQGWLDRQVDQVVLWLWQVPRSDYRYYHIMAYQQRYIADVTSLRETLDVPRNWYAVVTKALAVYMCETFEEAKKERLADLRQQQVMAFMPAQAEDRDGSDVTIFPDISAYT